MAACAAGGGGKDGAILERTPARAQCLAAIPRLIPRGLTDFLSLTGAFGSRRYPESLLIDQRSLRRASKVAMDARTSSNGGGVPRIMPTIAS